MIQSSTISGLGSGAVGFLTVVINYTPVCLQVSNMLAYKTAVMLTAGLSQTQCHLLSCEGWWGLEGGMGCEGLVQSQEWKLESVPITQGMWLHLRLCHLRRWSYSHVRLTKKEMQRNIRYTKIHPHWGGDSTVLVLSPSCLRTTTAPPEGGNGLWYRVTWALCEGVVVPEFMSRNSWDFTAWE